MTDTRIRQSWQEMEPVLGEQQRNLKRSLVVLEDRVPRARVIMAIGRAMVAQEEPQPEYSLHFV